MQGNGPGSAMPTAGADRAWGGGDAGWHDRGWPDPAARGPGTDAEGVAAATFRLRRELPGLGAVAARMPQAGEPPPGTRAVELAAPGAPVVSVAGRRCLPLWRPRRGRPCLRRGQPPRGTPRAPAAVCYLRAHRRRRPRHLAEEQVNQVHSAPMPGSPGRRALAVILAVIGVLAIIAGILYLAGAANSLHFMVGSAHKGHHLVRAAVSFVAGVALLAGAWFAARAGPNSRR